jgi:hypothetical protein
MRRVRVTKNKLYFKERKSIKNHKRGNKTAEKHNGHPERSGKQPTV